MCKAYWWIIDNIEYPRCTWRHCGNYENIKCTKLDREEFLECKKAMRGWGRYV